jgi:hypothetical protein
LWITSGAKQVVADGISGHHLPFARRFIESLESGGGEDGILTFSELWSEVEQIVTSEPRTGTLRHHESSGDFIFIIKPSSSTAEAEEKK